MKPKTVLVTGASAGIGKATAERLLADGGYTVYVAARRVEKMEDLRDKGAKPLKMDITQDDEIVAAVKQITSEAGGVDILINNAGFGLNGAMEDTAFEDVRYQFEVNLFGLGRLTQLVLPYMREQRAGTIVNVSSVGGKIYNPLGAWYIATKHALEGWSDCLHLELKPFGIDVVIIEPGAIGTEFDDVMLGPMLERSGDSAYTPMTKRLAAALERSFKAPHHRRASPTRSPRFSRPNARRRDTRRASYARTMLFIRKWGGDRVFDRFVMKFIG